MNSNLDLLSSVGDEPASPTINIAPLNSDSQRRLLDAVDDSHGPKAIETRNVNALKDAMALLAGQNFPQLLHPYTAWEFPGESQSWQVLRNSVLDRSAVQLIARKVAPNITIESIDRAISNHKSLCEHQNEILRHWETADNETSDNETSDDEDTQPGGDKPDFPKNVREVINKIANDYAHGFEWEAKLTSSLVNPAHIEDTWNDIALEPDVKEHVQRMLSFNIDRPEAYGILKRAQIGGALLYGPPGTGKTHLARVLAKQSNATMIQISAATIESKYIGETEKLIKALFNLGNMISPSIIFIDEADALFRMRTASDRSWETSRINQLLTETDGLLKDEKTRPFLVLATNYPSQLDHAVLRRIPGRIYLGPPSSRVREGMLRIYLKDEELDVAVRLPDLARMTDKYSGSDLRTVCISAATTSQSELESSGVGSSDGKRVLRMGHFHEALKANCPTITRQAMKEIERFADQFDRQSVEQIRSYFNIQPPIPTNRYENTPVPNLALDSESKDSPRRGNEQPRGDRDADVFSPPAQHSFRSSIIHVGDPASNEEIMLNEEPFRITKNLANALRWVKHHWLQYFQGRDSSEFLLWADAICINQEDNEEKSFQVPLMGKIYSAAEL
ncbi:ATPase family AAA domain-containing protein 1, partial [Apiospora hydei]